MVWQSVMSNIALTCVVGVAVVLVIALLFLFALVLSLTFDCWWTLGLLTWWYCVNRRFFNIDEDTGGLLDEMDEECTSRKPWLLRLQNGKLHTVKAYASDIELI
ncbi:hypothetical protein M3Y98_00127900 [Aphelenchoides besseyi]|nr:hypothetical protein M3Y98_00127900 [Aphelenchoides besseyi]KAI6199582.1 hypothetical protein M3Y96_00642200 [Aphelenchoides besseyi]